MTIRFADSDAQSLIRRTARAYFADQYPWERIYAIERGETRIVPEHLGELAELGWLALLAPTARGGGGISMLEAAVVVEECGYAAVPAPIAVSNIAAHMLSGLAPAAAGHIADVAAGRALVSVNESCRRHGRTQAPPPVVDAGAVRGTLALVPFGEHAASVLTPLAVDGAPAWALLSLDGCAREPVELLDRRGYANVRLEGTGAAAVELLATGDDAEALHERCDALVTAFSLIEISGMMQRVLEMTTEYISTRVQFGQPIAKFQAARHRAAELLMQAETVRWSAYHALWRFQEDPSDTREIWLAKHWAVRAAERVFEVTHLLHGGVGVGTEYPLHLYTQAIAASVVRAGTINEMAARTLESLRLAPAVVADGRAGA
jgi:alkylation response protein AidB-like acyl-CoA dehydrogenase